MSQNNFNVYKMQLQIAAIFLKSFNLNNFTFIQAKPKQVFFRSLSKKPNITLNPTLIISCSSVKFKKTRKHTKNFIYYMEQRQLED